MQLTKKHLSLLGSIINFILLVILPVLTYLNFSNVDSSIDYNSYLLRLNSLTTQLVIIGSFISCLMVLSFFLKPFSLFKLVISLSVDIFYIFYIIVGSKVENFEISVGNVYLNIDFSQVNLFLIAIPVLAIVRYLFKFVFGYKEMKYNLVIIEAIASGKSYTKSQIRKTILKNVKIDNKLKKCVLQKFDDLFKTLEIQRIIIKRRSFTLSQSGRNLLKFQKDYTYSSQEPLSNLEVWTESDLQKYAKIRNKKGV
ncbi:MAG: hypothetical protein ACFFE4_01580 [Candidatus Thorarchaeota archaeon]